MSFSYGHFGQKASNFWTKPLAFRTSDGENIRGKRPQPPSPNETGPVRLSIKV